jgi:hypothetical protein
MSDDPGRPLTDEEALAVEALAEDIAGTLDGLTVPAMSELAARVLVEVRLWANLAGIDRAEVIEAVLARLAACEKAEAIAWAALLGPGPTAAQRELVRQARAVMAVPGAKPSDIDI